MPTAPQSEKAKRPAAKKDDSNGATPPEQNATAPQPPAVAEAVAHKGHAKTSTYRVFACFDQTTEQDALEKGKWQSVGEFEVVNNEGQRSARKQAIEANANLREQIDEGEPLVLLCAPKKSLHPTKVAFEQREPRLLI